MQLRTAERARDTGMPSRIPFIFATLAALAVAAPNAASAQATEGNVTFEEILAAPGDPDLNIAYARQEIAAGRLQSAVSVLERLLLDEPDWDSARLAYGIVLYRLRDNLGAIREFVKLEGRNLSPSQERDRLKYMRLAESGERKLTLSGSIAAGLRVDTNPAAIADDPVQRPVEVERDTDGAFSAESVLRAEYDLGGDPGATLFFTVRGALRDYFETPAADITNLSSTGGVTFLGERLEVSLYGTGGVALQDDDLFARSAGFGASFAYDTANGETRTRYLAGVSATYESFDDTAFTGIAADRDGWRTALDAGVQHFITDAHRLSAGIGYDRKNTENDGFSYDRVALSAGYLALLGRGVYSDTSLSYTWLDYDAPNGFQTFDDAREDRTWRVRTALGAPLETMAGLAEIELPPVLGDIVVQAGVTYWDRSSNFGRYDFDNLGADLLFIKRFQF